MNEKLQPTAHSNSPSNRKQNARKKAGWHQPGPPHQSGTQSESQANIRDPETRYFLKGNPYEFRKGRSGNPSGLPREGREVSTEVFKERLNHVDPKLGKTELEVIVDGMIRRAKQGSYKDKKLLLAYGLGMPRQSLEVDAKVSFADALTRIRNRQQSLPANAVWTAPPQAEPVPTDSHTEALPDISEAQPEVPRRLLSRRAVEAPQDEIVEAGEPQSVHEFLARPTRESRQVNDEATLGNWRR